MWSRKSSLANGLILQLQGKASQLIEQKWADAQLCDRDIRQVPISSQGEGRLALEGLSRGIGRQADQTVWKKLAVGKRLRRPVLMSFLLRRCPWSECTLCSPSEGKKIKVKVKEDCNWPDKPLTGSFPKLICHWQLVFKKLYLELMETIIFYKGFLWEPSFSIFSMPFLGSTISILFVRGPFNHNNNGNL